MAQLLVRQIEDDIMERLKARAKANQRSMEAEVRALIAAAVMQDRPVRKLTDLVGAGVRPGTPGMTMDEIVEHVRRVRDGGEL